MQIDISVARKVLEVVDAGLVKGIGKPTPGQMCVEAAVCYAMGLPHSDEPTCVSPALRRLKIRLNDSNWSSDVARARGLRRLALAQLGSADAVDDKEFARRVVRLAIQTQVPLALHAAASLCKTVHKDKLLTLADLCGREPTAQNARDARAAACEWHAAAAAHAADAAYADADAADAAAYAAYAADAAAHATYATYAADAAAHATYATYAADAAAYAADARDRSLAGFAEGVVQILIEMKAPGCEWLSLTEERAA